ncbi:MAG: efflux RND transporter periplasmic adaptor subunit [Desulfitobacteriaceae bacterium]
MNKKWITILMNKKWITIVALGVLVLGGGYWAYKHFTAKPAVTTTTNDKVKLGDVRKSISATGTVNYLDPIPLSFQQDGKLIALNVKAGDIVKQGQVLAQLDTANLKKAVSQSQLGLLQAQQALQKIRDGFTEQTMATEQAKLATAQVNLLTAQQNADSNYLANQMYLANQNVLQKSNVLAKAQQSGVTSDIPSKQLDLSNAQSALTAAQNQQNGGAAQNLLAAQANVDAALAAVAQQTQGPKPEDLSVAQANIEQARTSLELANKNLSEATLIAPCDGIITTVTVQNYQNVSTTAIMTMAAGENSLQVDTAVDQADITQLKVGQKADITLDSVPNQHISGTVSQIAPLGTTVQNVTTFNVTILLDSPSSLLHASMSSNVSIIIYEAKNVLTIPSEAVRGTGDRKMVMVPGPATDAKTGTGNRNNSDSSIQGGTTGQGGQSTGNNAAMTGVNAHFVSIVTGLDDGTNVEIKSGLSEGQEVIVSTRSASTSAKTSGSTGSSGNPMGQLRGISGGGAPR